jgi:hypothetical protein
MINRLESILVITEDKQENFFEELSSLHNFDEWTNIEREVNLCRSLRMLQREMTSFWDNLRSKLSLRNTGGVEDKIKDVLEGERSFAELIGSSLDTLAKMKGNASITYTKAREAVENKLDELKETRRKLISSEISFYEII